MSEGRGSRMAYPDFEQAVAFHRALRARYGLDATGEVNETRLRATLERSRQVVDQQRGDIITIASFLLYGLIKDQAFGPGSTRTSLALTLAFLLRNGAAIVAPDEELAGISIGIEEGEVYAGMVEMWMREMARPVG